MSPFSAAADTASCVLDGSGLPIIIGGIAHIAYQCSSVRDALIEVMHEVTRARCRNHRRVPNAETEFPALNLSTSALVNIICGASSRTLTTVLLYPLCTVKTRLQASIPVPQLLQWQHSVQSAIQHTQQRGGARVLAALLSAGPRDLLLGATIAVAGALPSAFVYHSTYELLSEKLLHVQAWSMLNPWASMSDANRLEHTAPSLAVDAGPSLHPGLRHLLSASAGAAAAACIKVPCDVLKHRVQAYAFPNVAAAFNAAVSSQGLLSLYTGFGATLARDIPEVFIQFTLYSHLRECAIKWTAECLAEERRKDSSVGNVRVKRRSSGLCCAVHMGLGGLSGATAAVITNPLDVIKTQLQCGGGSGGVSVGSALKGLVEKRGLAGLFMGMGPRVLQTTLASALFFAAYEMSKKHVHAEIKRAAVAATPSEFEGTVASAAAAAVAAEQQHERYQAVRSPFVSNPSTRLCHSEANTLLLSTQSEIRLSDGCSGSGELQPTQSMMDMYVGPVLAHTFTPW